MGFLFNGTTSPSLARNSNLTGAMSNGKLTAATSRYGSITSGNIALLGSITPASISQTALNWWTALF